MASQVGQRRCDCFGDIKCIAEADNYLMVRRTHSIPYVMSLKEWNRLPVAEIFIPPEDRPKPAKKAPGP